MESKQAIKCYHQIDNVWSLTLQLECTQSQENCTQPWKKGVNARKWIMLLEETIVLGWKTKPTSQKYSKDFEQQEPEKAIHSGAITHRHARPQIHNDPLISHSNLRKSEKIFTKLMQPLDVQNPERLSTMKPWRASTCHHRLVMTNGLVPQNCAHLFIISQNWP